MQTPDELLYSTEHEWLRLEGDTGTIGITQYAVEQISDIVYVDLPKPGTAISAGKPFGAIESVKAVSELFAPVTGTVLESNAALADHPEAIAADPYGEGWLVRIKVKDAGEADTLLDAAGYESMIAGN